MKRSISTSLKIATLGGILALTSLTYAQAPAVSAPSTNQPAATVADPAGQSAHQSKWHGKKHMRNAHRDAPMLVPGLGSVSQNIVDSLKLTEEQTELLKSARQEQQVLHDARRQAMKTAFSARAEQMKSGALDPRAAIKAMDQHREQMRADQEKMQEKWLAVWDALNDGQRQILADSFRERAQQHVQRMQERAGRHAS